MGYCVHRYSVVKRWSEGKKWSVIQRCRKCDDWKRVDMMLGNGWNATKHTERIFEPGLENNVSESDKAGPIDPETGKIP